MEIRKVKNLLSLEIFSLLPEIFDLLLKEVCGLEDFYF